MGDLAAGHRAAELTDDGGGGSAAAAADLVAEHAADDAAEQRAPVLGGHQSVDGVGHVVGVQPAPGSYR
jgi:hypothetical protein